ncbi:MAG: hypothetical protein HKP43_01425 [Altererythrobacter sp.]|nr:hypothetical protein [Altererythrobacter sp.]NNK45271.1 hypothetical protein [Altererythrobacter sp.]
MVVLIPALVGAGWYFREPAQGYAQTATAYSARVACSCRFVAGRDLKDCEKDKLAGMELVTLTEDVAAQSVTARFPLISHDTANFREGYGCVLEEWEG